MEPSEDQQNPVIAGLSLDRPRLMGIVNVTPDSFSDGGQFADARAAADHGLRLVEEGADILDIGGESTRPGADPVSEQEEMDRVLPVIERLARETETPISLDTRKPRVMEEGSRAGAAIWNDVSALTHAPDSLETAARLACKVVLMHAQGDPKTMQDNPVYNDVVAEVRDFLAARFDACVSAGISAARLIADPGIGFGKTVDHNLTLLRNLRAFESLQVPLLVGASRKRFIGTLSGGAPAHRRLGGSVAVALWAAAQGAHVLRVHDVAETRQALNLWQVITRG
ncbi:MAG: dihydropteroate synthase [Alphaproteobacteria bacterium]